MAKINDLVDKVVKKESQLFEEQIERKRFDLKNELVAKQEESAQKLAQAKERVEAKANEQHQIAIQSRNIAYRDQLLSDRQAVLNALFDEAKTALNKLDADTFKGFVESILKQFSQQGQMSLVLGEFSQGLIDQNWLDRLELEGTSIQLSDDYLPAKGGFILEKIGAQYNFLNDTLVEEVRTPLTIEISRALNP